jgi:hypothetical protein
VAALAGAAGGQRALGKCMRRYHLSCQAFEFEVTTDDAGVIQDAPLIAAKFLNQNIQDLTAWVEKFSLAKIRRIPETGGLFE